MGIIIKTLKPVRYKGTEIEKNAVIEIDEGVYKDWKKLELCELNNNQETVKSDESVIENDEDLELPSEDKLIEAHVEDIKGNWYVLKTGEKLQGKENTLKRIKELIE